MVGSDSSNALNLSCENKTVGTLRSGVIKSTLQYTNAQPCSKFKNIFTHLKCYFVNII